MSEIFDHENRLVSAPWLTEQLAQYGYLEAGEVTSVVQRESRINETITSNFAELDITYSQNHRGDLPTNCLVKMLKPHLFEVASREATFYNYVARGEHSDALLKCYGTSISNEHKSTVILLEDKGTAGIKKIPWPLPPDLQTCEMAVRSLAEVHARWWESPQLDSAGFTKTDNRRIDEIASMFRSGYGGFCDLLGDALSPQRRSLLERIATDVIEYWKKHTAQGCPQTLVHGDAHFWNFLLPTDSRKKPVIIDWQDWEVAHGASDIAYMIGLHWFPERRERYEKHLLDIYLEELHSREVDYTADELWHDYRIRIALQPMVPVIQCYFQTPPMVWWPHIDRAFAAFDDLNCAEFLRQGFDNRTKKI